MRSVIQLGLADNGRGRYSSYVFPAEYYDIPGLADFQDIHSVQTHAVKELEPYRNMPVEIYVNSGMTIELLAVIWAADRLNISLRVMHYDRSRGIYIPQQVTWKRSKFPASEQEAYILCKGRHNGMKGKPLFEPLSEEKMFDFIWQQEHAKKVLSEGKRRTICLYISGLTSLCVSVLNAAHELDLPVVAFHYNYDTEEYFPQAFYDTN